MPPILLTGLQKFEFDSWCFFIIFFMVFWENRRFREFSRSESWSSFSGFADFLEVEEDFLGVEFGVLDFLFVTILDWDRLH